ncbi:Uncharacterised protein [Mycobacteroides abscessus subsp. abscessus]|nr:Uncharacterised protein [Mycobacteroides abscessus subsp. abscessus]
MISRPAAEAADRRKLLTAGFFMIRSAADSCSWALGERPGAAAVSGCSAGTAASLAARISEADSRSMVCPYLE